MADEPTPSELERLIERNHREIGADLLDLKSQLTANVGTLLSQFDRYVLAAVYEANERAREAREKAQDDQIRDVKDELVHARRSARGAVLAGVSSIVAAIIVAVVLGAMKGTGH